MTQEKLQAQVRRWMHAHVQEYVDRNTGEANSTQLAESAAQAFDLYEDDAEATIPEWVFEEAANF